MRSISFVVGLALLTSQASAADDICERFKKFAPHADARRTWIEVRWTGKGLGDPDYGMQCARSDEGATELCEWVVKNSSWEFPHALPMRILQCAGYTFPKPFRGWKKWDAEIPIQWRDAGYSLLEVKFSESGAALRFSGFAPGQDEDSQQIPPLGDVKPR